MLYLVPHSGWYENELFLAWLWRGGSVGWSVVLYNMGLQVQFPVRAHAWVVGSIPGWGEYRRQPFDLSLSLSLSLFLSSSLSKITDVFSGED